MATPIAVGSRFGDWELIAAIGKGGNGTVWKVRHHDGVMGAMKFLHSQFVVDGPRYQRFLDEVKAMQKCSDIEGVIPLLDSHVPVRANAADRPWLVTLLATPLRDALPEDPPLEQVVRLCLSLATTLAAMHDRNVAHRDIKPENVFWDGHRWTLGDLGLADFPDKAAITTQGEKLGPMYYMAPEMLNDAGEVDGRPADVFSLSKLLWKLATGQRFPVPGAQGAGDAASLSAYVKERGTHTLDRLIEAATQLDARRRPQMAGFRDELAAWLAPSPEASGPLDLGSLKKRIQNAVQPHAEMLRRRSETQAKGTAELERVFKLFSPTLSSISAALVGVGIEQTHLSGLGGGNATFYRAATGDWSSGTTGGAPVWFFESTVKSILRNDRIMVTFLAGVNVGISNVRDDPEPLYDLLAPVSIAVGYVLLTSRPTPGGQWPEGSTPLWVRADTFVLGQPSEQPVVSRLIIDLEAHLQGAAHRFVEEFESAG